jgi:phosphodiesterase/alkaline phosphatase D-like protein
MIHDRTMRLGAWVALVVVLVAALPARPGFVQAESSPLPAARLEPFAYGVAAGDITSGSAVLWTRTPGPASVVSELAASETFENPTALPAVPATAATDFTVKVVATGLQPGTRYYYRFKAGEAVSPVGTFKTPYAADQDATVTFAFSGDADWRWKPYPLLHSLTQEKLDFFLFLGDLIYETTDLRGQTAVEDLAGYRWKYRENREPRAGEPADGPNPMLALYGQYGQYSIFDNHETGLSKADQHAPSYNEGGARAGESFVNQTEGFKARLQAYREYQPVREEVVSGTGDPRADGTGKFYRSVSWGANVQLIIVDDRSYRDRRLAKSDDPATLSCDRTMLGAAQMQWLQGELLAAKRRGVTWKVIVVSSPMQQLGKASQVGIDLDTNKSWPGGYLCERNRLLAFIDSNAIDNVVFLTTDNHYTVINNLLYNPVPDDPTSPLRRARNAFEILTGPIGAISGRTPLSAADIQGLARREADRKILDVWNGDAPGRDGKLQGLKQAGLDPIGLEPDFPGLDLASLRATGAPAGQVVPLDFASFHTYAYVVLTFDKTHLSVTAKGFPSVRDPATLYSADTLREYEGRRAEEIFHFRVQAQ